MAKSLVDMDEEDLRTTFNHALGEQGAKEAAASIRKMIEHALIAAGVIDDD